MSVDACTTRLRLVVADQKAVDEAALRALGARGLVRPSAESLQVVVGPIADQLASEIRAEMRNAAVGAQALLDALGGAANVRDLQLSSSRLCVTLEDAAAVRQSAIDDLPNRGIVRPSSQTIHIVIGPSAQALFDQLNELWAAPPRSAPAHP